MMVRSHDETALASSDVTAMQQLRDRLVASRMARAQQASLLSYFNRPERPVVH
jgi:hypothetical protein